MSKLEAYFEQFRKNIIGIDAEFESPYGRKKIIYADWIASGRLYLPIEDAMKNTFGPFVGNTHSEASETGVSMTMAYHQAQKIIKKHVNASADDVIITTGTGMTGAISKFQRILGLRVPEQAKLYCAVGNQIGSACINLPETERPVVFVTHMEHHSNHTSWLESIADVVVIEPAADMNVNPENLKAELEKYKNRPLKIGSFSACSNVTGITPPYYELAKLMHEYNGICLVDFAASAPYVEINMHPADPKAQLDAIFFSPHKFLGGPGSSGVLIFNKKLYKNTVPDQPGGGTVEWTDRWGRKSYIDDIETREDGGTPGFLQTIRIALSIRLKEKMGVKNIHDRENELIEIAFSELRKIDKLNILVDTDQERIGVFSFYITGIHHNLMVRMLNDRFGIQVRGGCSCAGTYGHYLLDVSQEISSRITGKIDQGDASEKPGWIRLSLHPTMTNAELLYCTNAIKETVENAIEWKSDYQHDKRTNEWFHKSEKRKMPEDFDPWFQF